MLSFTLKKGPQISLTHDASVASDSMMRQPAPSSCSIDEPKQLQMTPAFPKSVSITSHFAADHKENTSAAVSPYFTGKADQTQNGNANSRET